MNPSERHGRGRIVKPSMAKAHEKGLWSPSIAAGALTTGRACWEDVQDTGHTFSSKKLKTKQYRSTIYLLVSGFVPRTPQKKYVPRYDSTCRRQGGVCWRSLGTAGLHWSRRVRTLCCQSGKGAFFCLASLPGVCRVLLL